MMLGRKKKEEEEENPTGTPQDNKQAAQQEGPGLGGPPPPYDVEQLARDAKTAVHLFTVLARHKPPPKGSPGYFKDGRDSWREYLGALEALGLWKRTGEMPHPMLGGERVSDMPETLYVRFRELVDRYRSPDGTWAPEFVAEAGKLGIRPEALGEISQKPISFKQEPKQREAAREPEQQEAAREPERAAQISQSLLGARPDANKYPGGYVRMLTQRAFDDVQAWKQRALEEVRVGKMTLDEFARGLEGLSRAAQVGLQMRRSELEKRGLPETEGRFEADRLVMELRAEAEGVKHWVAGFQDLRLAGAPLGQVVPLEEYIEEYKKWRMIPDDQRPITPPALTIPLDPGQGTVAAYFNVLQQLQQQYEAMGDNVAPAAPGGQPAAAIPPKPPPNESPDAAARNAMEYFRGPGRKLVEQVAQSLGMKTDEFLARVGPEIVEAAEVLSRFHPLIAGAVNKATGGAGVLRAVVEQVRRELAQSPQDQTLQKMEDAFDQLVVAIQDLERGHAQRIREAEGDGGFWSLSNILIMLMGLLSGNPIAGILMALRRSEKMALEARDARIRALEAAVQGRHVILKEAQNLAQEKQKRADLRALEEKTRREHQRAQFLDAIRLRMEETKTRQDRFDAALKYANTAAKLIEDIARTNKEIGEMATGERERKELMDVLKTSSDTLRGLGNAISYVRELVNSNELSETHRAALNALLQRLSLQYTQQASVVTDLFQRLTVGPPPAEKGE